MDLILWRHAEAEDTSPDAQRKLTAHGEKQAKLMAHWLKERLPENVQVLTSPAVRCIQTTQALDLPFEESAQLSTSANAIEILSAAGWPHANGAVLVVGHQPTLGRVAALLLTGKEAEWNIKKGTAWWFLQRGSEVIVRAVIGTDLA